MQIRAFVLLKLSKTAYFFKIAAYLRDNIDYCNIFQQPNSIFLRFKNYHYKIELFSITWK